MTLLKIENLMKSYGTHKASSNTNLEVNQKKVVVILGPSGYGKSTLFRCINGPEKIAFGTTCIDAETITEDYKHWTKMRQKAGMVFQSYELFEHLSVRENILLGPLKVQKRQKDGVLREAKIWLEKVGPLYKPEVYPRELSGGQKQCIAIVRSLCMNSMLMLSDEVTVALDSETVKEVLEVMLNLAKEGMTMPIVTHEMNFAKAVTDRIVLMDNGEIVEISKPEEFLQSSKAQRAKKFLDLFDFHQ